MKDVRTLPVGEDDEMRVTLDDLARDQIVLRHILHLSAVRGWEQRP
jgi:hypothetical protein